jgi:hypothetical protein
MSSVERSRLDPTFNALLKYNLNCMCGRRIPQQFGRCLLVWGEGTAGDANICAHIKDGTSRCTKLYYNKKVQVSAPNTKLRRGKGEGGLKRKAHNISIGTFPKSREDSKPMKYRRVLVSTLLHAFVYDLTTFAECIGTDCK